MGDGLMCVLVIIMIITQIIKILELRSNSKLLTKVLKSSEHGNALLGQFTGTAHPE
ncbi:MAG: hypothetical protein WCT27_01115 [Patescibacteria group bacterium]|jgi:hypothetical protein